MQGLPQTAAEKREEILTIARIDFLPFHLSKGNRRWLEKLKTDPREAVKREATAAWEARFARSLRCPSDEDEENEPWEEYLPEDDGPEPESTAVPSELPDDLDLPF